MKVVEICQTFSMINGDGVEEEREDMGGMKRRRNRGIEIEKSDEKKATAFRGLSLNVGLQGKNKYIEILITIILCYTMLIILHPTPKKRLDSRYALPINILLKLKFCLF